MQLQLNIELVLASLFGLLVAMLSWFIRERVKAIQRELERLSQRDDENERSIKQARDDALQQVENLRQNEVRELYQLIREESRSTREQVTDVLNRVIDMQQQINVSAAATQEAALTIQMMGRRKS